MPAPGVAQEILTDCGPEYVPVPGEITGVATVAVGDVMVINATETADVVNPAFTAKALTVVVALTENVPV